MKRLTNSLKYPKSKIVNRVSTLFLVLESKRIIESISRLIRYYKMTLDFRTLDRMVIVTGASSTHQKSLIQLLKSLEIYTKGIDVHVFDLGLDDSFKSKLEDNWNGINLKFHSYDFKSKPSWMDIKNSNKGEWAWKSDCIKQVVTLVDNVDEESIPTTFLWLDAGNKMISKPIAIQRYIQCYGFWSPASEGIVEKWTSKKQIDHIIGSARFNQKVNLNGAMIGFNSRNLKSIKLLEDWHRYSLIKDVIAPEGSDKSNHRQDQSLLTLLAYNTRLAPVGLALRMHVGSILQHQDID
jgi:hypothetical protein